MNVYLSTAYLAPIEYYSKFLCANSNIYIEQNENYIKQTYRNRCTILSANGPISLTVPIEAAGGVKTLMRDVRIAEHDNWRHLHWNALVSAYNSTPFFEYYQDYFQPFYEIRYEFLFDFNERLRHMICDLLDIDTPKVKYTSEYISGKEIDGIDFRQNISPKKDWKISDPHFISHPYYQVFEHRFGFVENLSIVDLLFNMGNESLIILSNSNKKTF